MRGIQHPGVEIREHTVGSPTSFPSGSYAHVAGFADKGDDLNPKFVASMDDFEANFGTPTNEAEVYSYYASKNVLNAGGSLVFSKVPYDNDYSQYYQALTINVDNANVDGFANDGTIDTTFAVAVVTDANVLSSGTKLTITGSCTTGVLNGAAFEKVIKVSSSRNSTGELFDKTIFDDIDVFGTANVDFPKVIYSWDKNTKTLKFIDSDNAVVDQVVLTEAGTVDGVSNVSLEVKGSYQVIDLSLNTGLESIIKDDPAFDDEIGSFKNTRSINIGSYYMQIENGDYSAIDAGADFNEFIDTSADYLVVLDKKAVVNQDNEGIFVTVVDALDAMYYQRILDTDPMTVNKIMTLTDTDTGAVTTNLNNKLFVNDLGSNDGTDLRGQGTLSELIGSQFPVFDYVDGGQGLDTTYGDYIGVVVGKTFKDYDNDGKLGISIVESHFGSLIVNKKDPSTGQSAYIGDRINALSNNIKFYKDRSFQDFDKIEGNTKHIDTGSDIPLDNKDLLIYKYDTVSSAPRDNFACMLGFTEQQSKKLIDGEGILNNLDTIYGKIENILDMQVDYIVDAGLSTIAEYCSGATDEDDVVNPLQSKEFVPVYDMDDYKITKSSSIDIWRAVCQRHIVFCEKIRKDCMALIDVPRNLVLNGAAKYIRKSKPDNTFMNTIGKNLKYCTGLNSSYAALYANWCAIVDSFSGKVVWVPESVEHIFNYISTDLGAGFYYSPAGLNRGKLPNTVDIAFNPNGKEEDMLFTKGFNYAKRFPTDGYIAWGSKTTLTKPSGFQEVGIRRLFLRLERATYMMMRYYIEEMNNSFTRRQIVDQLTPLFARYKSKQAIEDFKLVCDETNNTPAVRANQELKLAVMIKPAHSIWYIMADFYNFDNAATSFDEVILA